jgi:hypothetical protein
MRHNPPSTSAAVGTETTSDVNNSNGERKEVKKKEDGFKRIGKHRYFVPYFNP